MIKSTIWVTILTQTGSLKADFIVIDGPSGFQAGFTATFTDDCPIFLKAGLTEGGTWGLKACFGSDLTCGTTVSKRLS